MTYLIYETRAEECRGVSRGADEHGKKAVNLLDVHFKRILRASMLTELLGSSLPWSPSLLSECSTAVRK